MKLKLEEFLTMNELDTDNFPKSSHFKTLDTKDQKHLLYQKYKEKRKNKKVEIQYEEVFTSGQYTKMKERIENARLDEHFKDFLLKQAKEEYFKMS